LAGLAGRRATQRTNSTAAERSGEAPRSGPVCPCSRLSPVRASRMVWGVERGPPVRRVRPLCRLAGRLGTGPRPLGPFQAKEVGGLDPIAAPQAARKSRGSLRRISGVSAPLLAFGILPAGAGPQYAAIWADAVKQVYVGTRTTAGVGGLPPGPRAAVSGVTGTLPAQGSGVAGGAVWIRSPAPGSPGRAI
jgi:hypothetical protein